METFAPNREELWQLLCQEMTEIWPVTVEIIPGDGYALGKVRAQYQNWTLTLDYHWADYNRSLVYTRLRTPYINATGLRFRIYRGDMFSEWGKLLGLQDLTVGIPAFDQAFVIQGNDPAQICTLLRSTRLQTLMQQQPELHLEVKDDEGWFGQEFPEGVDELVFQVAGCITERKQLRGLYDLFVELLTALCQLGAATPEKPAILL